MTSPDTVDLAVVGAHLSGMALNHELTERGGRLALRTTTAACYRLFLLPGTEPQKPGLCRHKSGGWITVEVWELPLQAFGDFVRKIRAPLGIGQLELADGRWVSGFICEPWGLEGAEDITSHGGFREYLATKTAHAAAASPSFPPNRRSQRGK